MKIPRIHIRWFAVAIVAITTTLAIISSLGDAPIVDEVPHIGAGFSYVRALDMRLNPEHPPLAKDLAGLSLLALPFDHSPFAMPQWTSQTNGQWEFGRHVIYYSGVNGDTVKNIARLPELLFFLICCWIVWQWTRERYGETSALIALILLAFSPTILAHARFVTTDMAAATAVIASTYYFLRYLRTPTKTTFAVATLVLGLALLAKFNTALLGPYFLIVGALYGYSDPHHSGNHLKYALRYTGRALLVGVASFMFVVWPVYIVQTWHYPMDRQIADTQSIAWWYKNNPIKAFTFWGVHKPIIRAAAYWTLGLDMAAQRSEGGNAIYWLGNVVNSGGRWYFPLVYFLKEPLAWWILVSIAIGTLIFHKRYRIDQPHTTSWLQQYTDEWVMLLWLAIYWAVSIHSTLNIGIRHLLPVYPFSIILVSGRVGTLLEWLRTHNHIRWRRFSIAIACILGWYVFESVHVFPSYLTYFNQIAGGPGGGYRYVVDSNLDWGQDLKRLAGFVENNHISRLTLDYFGWADPAWYLKEHYSWANVSFWSDANDFITRNQSDGWIAVSATFFQNSVGENHIDARQNERTYRWLLNYKPVAVIGNSIFVWHITSGGASR